MKSSHFDNKGSARMIDISTKKISKRIAIACSKIFMKKNTFDLIKDGNHKKGDVLAIARIAAIMSVKKTHDLIPLCHPINIEAVEINFKLNRKNFSVESLITCKTTNKTGIEMEALTAASVAASCAATPWATRVTTNNTISVLRLIFRVLLFIFATSIYCPLDYDSPSTCRVRPPSGAKALPEPS